MSTRGALAVVAAIVIAAGFVLALLPVSAKGVQCGTALHPDKMGAITAEFQDSVTAALRGERGGGEDAYADACEDRVSSQRTAAFLLVGVGGLALLFVALTVVGRAPAVNEPVEQPDP